MFNGLVSIVSHSGLQGAGACNGISRMAAGRRTWRNDYMERGEEKRCDPQKVLPGRAIDRCVGAELFQG